MCFIKLIRDEGRVKGEKKESKIEKRKYMREEKRGRAKKERSEERRRRGGKVTIPWVR